MDAKTLEALLRRSNPAIEAERAAAAAGRWADYLEERVPPPAMIHPRQRAAWREARDQALAIGCRVETREVLVAPVWFCSNDDDIPGSKWEHATLICFDDEAFELHERKAAPEVALATIEQARLGFLVRAREYAPDVALAFRNAHYGALESRRLERVTEIRRIVPSAEIPRPERDLPPFATDAAPARELDRLLDGAIAERIDAALAKLRVFPDGAEALVATKPRL